jgi:hypothetical protein
VVQSTYELLHPTRDASQLHVRAVLFEVAALETHQALMSAFGFGEKKEKKRKEWTRKEGTKKRESYRGRATIVCSYINRKFLIVFLIVF